MADTDLAGSGGTPDLGASYKAQAIDWVKDNIETLLGYYDPNVVNKATSMLESAAYFGRYEEDSEEARELFEALTEQESTGAVGGSMESSAATLARLAQDQYYRPIFERAYTESKRAFDPLNNPGSSTWEIAAYGRVNAAFDRDKEARFKDFLRGGYIPWALGQGKEPTGADYAIEMQPEWAAQAMAGTNLFTDGDRDEKVSQSRTFLATLKQREDSGAQVKKTLDSYIKRVDDQMGDLDVASEEWKGLAQMKAALQSEQDVIVGGWMAPGGGYDAAVLSGTPPLAGTFNWVSQMGGQQISQSLGLPQAADLGTIVSGAVQTARAPGEQAKAAEEAATQETERVGQSEDFGQTGNQALDLLRTSNPAAYERLRERFGDDPAATVFQLAGGDPGEAQADLTAEIKLATAQARNAGQYQTLFGDTDLGTAQTAQDANFLGARNFDRTQLSPGVAQKLQQGLPLTEADAMELARSNRATGVLSNALSAQGGSVQERQQRLDTRVAELWKGASSDPAAFQQALAGEIQGAEGFEDWWRSQFADRKTPEEQRRFSGLPTGGRRTNPSPPPSPLKLG